MEKVTDNFEQLVSKYRKTVFRVALGYVKNVHDADDIAQNVFLKLYSKSDGFDSQEVLKAWLIRVAINESKNLLKSSWLKKREALDESLVATTGSEDLSLHEYIRKLKPKYRTAVYLFYFEGYSANEVAKILKLPPSTVSTHLHRAREQLKEMIVKEDNYYGQYGKQINENL